MKATQQTVFITGATAGIGRHLALHLARRGFHVIASGRRPDALEKLASEAGDLHLDTLQLDVTDAGSIARAVLEVDRLTRGRGVDALVNNAGYGLIAPALETTDDDLRRQFDTNVFGLMAVTRAFVPKMLVRRRGRVINVSSIGGRITLPFFGAYNASKYAVESLSDALRRELRAFGIQVALIEPGAIRSEFASTSMAFVDRYRNDSSPFAVVYERAGQLQKAFERTEVGPECVAEAVEHAIRARRARPRYVVPLSSRLMMWVAGWLPTRWIDALMARAVGLTPRALPAPSTTVSAAS